MKKFLSVLTIMLLFSGLIVSNFGTKAYANGKKYAMVMPCVNQPGVWGTYISCFPDGMDTCIGTDGCLYDPSRPGNGGPLPSGG